MTNIQTSQQCHFAITVVVFFSHNPGNLYMGYMVVNEVSARCCFLSFMFLFRHIFTRHVLLFFTNRHVRMWLGCLVAPPSLYWLRMYSAKQTQNATFTRLKSMMFRITWDKFHIVWSFKQRVSLVCHWKLSQQICNAHCFNFLAELVLLSSVCCFS